VERRPHPTDRRIWQLYLTPKAGPMLARMRELGDRTRREAFGGVPPAEQEQFVRLLAKLKDNLTKACG
jgi:MarR family transcriptional regulator for hemolysin